MCLHVYGYMCVAAYACGSPRFMSGIILNNSSTLLTKAGFSIKLRAHDVASLASQLVWGTRPYPPRLGLHVQLAFTGTWGCKSGPHIYTSALAIPLLSPSRLPQRLVICSFV